MEVTAKSTKTDESVTVEYDFGESIDDLVELFGPDVCYTHARQSIVVALQGFIRSSLNAGKSADEIQAEVEDWKPGQRRRGKSKAEKLREQISEMSAEERAALIESFTNGTFQEEAYE